MFHINSFGKGSIENTKLYPGILSYRGSITVSLETYPLYSFIIITIQLELKKQQQQKPP